MPKPGAKLSLIIFLLMAGLLATAQLAPVSVKRNLPQYAEAGKTIEITLDMKFIGDAPSGIIVTEFLPEGFEITSSIPAFTGFDGKASWLLYGEKVKNSRIVYELKVPESFSGPVLLQGNWETISQAGAITGDVSLVPKADRQEPAPPAPQPTPPSPPAQQPDYMLYIIGGGIILLLVILVILVAARKKK